MSKKRKAVIPAAVQPYLFTAGFFLLVCLTVNKTIKGLALACVAAVLLVGVKCFSRLRERFTLPMLAATAFVVMGGVSTFYAIAGKFALQEFLKLLISLCAAVLLLVWAPGEGVAPGRKVAGILSRFCAFSGLVSIDLISTRILSGIVTGFLGIFTSDYTNLAGVEPGVRLLSLFETPNVFAAVMGIGVLLSLGLILSSETMKERAEYTAYLAVSALSFVLAFSMGAIAFIAVAFLVYLLVERTDRRASLFVLMVETLVVTLACVVPIAATSLDAWSGMQPIPLLCAVAGAIVLVILDRFVGQKLGEKLSAHSKLISGVIVGVVALVGVVIVLAYNLTGGIALQAGETLRRSAYPAPGSYTMSAQAGENVRVTVESQNQVDTMMRTSTVLYQGVLSEADFTVPEDSLVVYFNFSAGDAVFLDGVVCEGEKSVSVPLGYKLLPGFIANRVQGLFANQNAIQRTVFFEDGMKIFARSPIVGSGLGAYENAIKSVQSFYYETKYAHNHYIQVLAELGMIGFILFVGLIVVCAVVIFFDRRKKETMHPMTPALAAVLVFMAGHALVEVDFSYYAYLPVAFGVFAVIALCCGRSLSVRWMTNEVQDMILPATGILMVVFTGFLIANMMAASMVAGSTTFDMMRRAAGMDAFEKNDYKLSFIISAIKASDEVKSLVEEQADQFAYELSQVKSNTIPYYLAIYYMENGLLQQGLDMIEKYVHYVPSDQTAWDNAYKLLFAYTDDSELCRTRSAEIIAFMEQWNAENYGTITMSEDGKMLMEQYGL